MGSLSALRGVICRIFTHSRWARKVQKRLGYLGGCMFRSLLRLVLVLVLLVGAAAFFLGWWGGDRIRPIDGPAATVGTTGRIDTEKAKAVGADVAAKAAEAANQAADKLAPAPLTPQN